MEQLIAGLLLWISQNSSFDYQPDMGLPVIEQVEQRRLVSLYMGEAEQPQGYISESKQAEMYQYLESSIEAVYAADHNTIYLGERVDPATAYGRSVLVHELIHFLQYRHLAHEHVSCSNALEKDAYLVQAKYMKQKQLKVPFNTFTIMMRSLCEDEF